MDEQGPDVRQLMEEVSTAVAGPPVVIDFFKGVERPRVFNLNLLYPHAKSFGTNLGLLSRKCVVKIQFEVGSKRKYSGWLVVLVKRIVLALTSWYMHPLSWEFSEFNMLVASTLVDISKSIEEIRDGLDSLKKAQDELRARVSEKEEAES